MSKKDDDAAAFYADPANRVPAGPGRKRQVVDTCSSVHKHGPRMAICSRSVGHDGKCRGMWNGSVDQVEWDQQKW